MSSAFLLIRHATSFGAGFPVPLSMLKRSRTRFPVPLSILETLSGPDSLFPLSIWKGGEGDRTERLL